MMPGVDLRWSIGLAAVAFPVLHALAGALDLLRGGPSPALLCADYVAAAAVPFFVLGLHAVQRPRAGWLSLAGAVAYGAASVFFAGATLCALAHGTGGHAAAINGLGLLYPAHGALLAAGGLLFGTAVVRAGVLPGWTGLLLAAGAALGPVLPLLPPLPPEVGRVAAGAVRDAALVGMGGAVLGRTLRP